MPELPEVETIVRGLNQHILGRIINKIEVRSPHFIQGDAATFAPTIEGRSVQSIRRHGKFIFVDLIKSSLPPVIMKIHLGMTGQLLLESPELPVQKHTHVIFHLSGLKSELRHRDMRRFGYVEVMTGKGPHLGPDAWLSTDEEVFSALRKKSGMLKHALLNQAVIAGLGNIYVDESLFRTGLHPRRTLESLSSEKLKQLCLSIRHVLSESLNVGGTSFRNYLDTKGSRGGFKGRLKVYGKEGKLCEVCGSIIKRILVAGRSSHICPKCQRAPRHKF